MKKLITLFLCFIMFKAMGQNIKINFYSSELAQPPTYINYDSYYTNHFDKLFDHVYVNGLITRNKNFTNAKAIIELPIIPFDRNKSDFPDVIILDNFGQPISLAQVNCLIKYVKEGGILIMSSELVEIIETGESAALYISNELLCNNVTLTYKPYFYIKPCNTEQYKFHPHDGVLLLNENGANAVYTTQSYDAIAGIPSENIIIGNECGNNITNCNQKEAMQFIIPAFPGLGALGPNNTCDIKGFAILNGEGASGKIFDKNANETNINLIQLIYDFLHNPLAMQKRYEWSNIKANVNVDCPPNVPIGYSNASLTTPIPVPTINSSSAVLSNTCPNLTVNLISKITSTTPANMELRWFTNPNHYGELYSTPTTSKTGIYYAYYFDPSNNCYSLASEPIKVETISCNSCTNDFASLNPTVISGFNTSIIGSNPHGLYWIKSDITISNYTFFKDAEILIEPNVTINVIGSSNAQLEIISSHLFTCNGRWNGIVALRNSRLIIDGTDDIANNIHTSTLIEDAETAITYHPEVVDILGDEPILSINNTIFNRNNVGLKITDDYYYSRGLGFNNGNKINNSYRSFIKSTLFTSRDIPFTVGQYNWDNFKTITNNNYGNYPNQPPKYSAPYIDDISYPDNFPKAFLKDPINLGLYTNKKPLAGILLDNLSYVNINYEKVCVNIGAETAIGDNGEVTVFDNLQYGIKATDANFIVTNCSFQKPIGNGVGISASSSFENSVYNSVAGYGSPYKNINKIVISKNLNKPSNAFFDMNRAIDIGGIDEVEVKYCDIRSNQNPTNLAQNGGYGISIGNTSFKSMVIEENNIVNIRNGIYFGGATEGGTDGFGKIEVNKNRFSKEISQAYPITNGFIENAITGYAYFESKYGGVEPINIKQNSIKDAYNGVWLSGWISKKFNILNNEITLAVDGNIAPSAKHYGIKIDGGGTANLQFELDANGNVLLDANGVPVQTFGTKGENLIQDNKIWGAGISTTTAKPNAGIWLSQQCNTNIGCNQVWASDNAYKFEGLCLLTKFMDNYIYTDNQYGYTLYDGAQIGKQGQEVNSSASNDDICVSNNDFIDKQDWINQAHKMTYTDNSDPTYSPLVIRTGSNIYDRFNPDGVGFSNQNFYIYGIGNGLISTTSANDGSECERCLAHPTARKIKKSLLDLMEEIAAGTTTIPNDQPNLRLEVMQQQLFELVKARPEIAQSSSDIQQFIYDNQWQSLDFIYYAGYYASRGNMDMLNTLLDYWTPTNSEQDNNYHTYYEWLVQMYETPGWKPNVEQVREMANRCPIIGGSVIYAARNLYNALTKEIHKFDNACEGNNTGARGVKKQIEMIRLKQPKVKPIISNTQSISIYPNPANNILNIKGVNAKQIIVVDAMGRIVMNIQNKSLPTQQLNIESLQKGIYLIKVVDANNKIFTNKFIKE